MTNETTPDAVEMKMFACDHCGERRPDSEGADDAVERAVGPICDTCWANLPPHVHRWAEGREPGMRPREAANG